MKRTLGFTIVEIIVVITAIGILATIGIVSYSGVQMRARDTERKADAESMQAALETFYEQSGRYPALIYVSSGSPSNAELGKTPDFYTSDLRMPSSALVAPGSTTGTTISWQWNTTPTSTTYSLATYSSAPPTNTLCQAAATPAPTCVRYVIRWLRESDNSIQQITSKFGN